MIALAVVIGILLIISLLRVGASAEYGEDGVEVRLQIGPFNLMLYPAKSKAAEPEKEKREKKPKKKKEKKKEEKSQKPGALSLFKAIWPTISKALSRIKRRLTVNELTLFYIFGSPDPANTAISFGRASAGAYTIMPLLEKHFKIKKRDLRTGFDFNRQEPYIYVKLRMSFAIWELVYIGVGFAFGFLRGMLKSKAEMKKKNKQSGDVGTSKA